MQTADTPEHLRMQEDAARQQNWKRWGPYLSERQWGTVREDYSGNGDAWNYLPHADSSSRTYRWGEDGLLGISDRECRLCFALALWNGRDPILKERLFGLTNPQGNHGEDAKEVWYYLESTPTHSYMKGLYKYPQAEFPYAQLVEENARRSREEREYELDDTGVFDEQRYFDVFVEYAKESSDDILIRIQIENRGPDEAPIHLLPTLGFRNTWSWGKVHGATKEKPFLQKHDSTAVFASHETLGLMRLDLDTEAPLLFCENETNTRKLFGDANGPRIAKDGLHEAVLRGNAEAVSQSDGNKCAPHYSFSIPGGASRTVRLRLSRVADFGSAENPGALMERTGSGRFARFDEIFAKRIKECSDFYATKIAPTLSVSQQNIARQAYAGLLWSKQFYHYIVPDWRTGDPTQPQPPDGHASTRNADWEQLYAADILSMPDKWEYPWFAAWDLAFHMIPMARVDPEFAKSQLELLLREWYMHPNGQIPAYEWNFGDVNPPVHAWACWRVYKISGPPGGRDRVFLERCFQKLLLNFTWWVNRKDVQGKHIFSGGFLGLDNIGLFDRSRPLPTGHTLAQADGTAWMAFYSATMLAIALELAQTNAAYEDIASKFFEHCVQIIDAMNTMGGCGLWDEEDGFYYDQLLVEGRTAIPLRLCSLVGIIPLLAIEILDERCINALPGFRKRLEWFLENRPDLAQFAAAVRTVDGSKRRLLAVASKERLRRVLHHVLDEEQLLSNWGIRSLSKRYETDPYLMQIDDAEYCIHYEPGESQSGLFGGNSNWRGPVWFPLNYLLIEALERYHYFYGDTFLVEFPTGSGDLATLQEISQQLAVRLTSLFENGPNGRPCLGSKHAGDPHWNDYLLFHEYFHAETGEGLGASHQTGWTSLITRCFGIVSRIDDD